MSPPGAQLTGSWATLTPPLTTICWRWTRLTTTRRTTCTSRRNASCCSHTTTSPSSASQKVRAELTTLTMCPAIRFLTKKIGKHLANIFDDDNCNVLNASTDIYILNFQSTCMYVYIIYYMKACGFCVFNTGQMYSNYN